MLSLQEGQSFDGQYELKRLIDTGGFTEVWEARYLVAGNTVALKVYPRLDEEGCRNIEEEYKKLFELQHSNLVNVLHFGKYNGYPYLVMRFYSGGNASRKIGDCSEQEIAKCLLQIGGVLKYLHANDFVHQDIKPNNFLLDQYGNYYLADMGLSLKVRNTIKMYTRTAHDKEVSSIQTGITPPPYRAPELYDRQGGSQPVKATDIWALGASLYEMITGDTPYGDLGGLMQVNNAPLRDLPPQYSPGLNRILKDCLEKEPWKRPAAAQLEKMANHYIEDGKWPEEERKDKEEEKKKKNLHPLVLVVIIILLFTGGVFVLKMFKKPWDATSISRSDPGKDSGFVIRHENAPNEIGRINPTPGTTDTSTGQGLASIITQAGVRMKNIENANRIIEKTAFDYVYKSNDSKYGFDYNFNGSATYNLTIIGNGAKASSLSLKVYKIVNNQWVLDEQFNTDGVDYSVVFRAENTGIRKVELSCVFMGSNDVVPVGLIIDREN